MPPGSPGTPRPNPKAPRHQPWAGHSLESGAVTIPASDPFASVAQLEGVGAAAAHARDAIDALLRHRAMRHDSGRVAAESALQGARASAQLEGADRDRLEDPVVQGALRATGEIASLARIWEQAPMQALARLHTLAARDLVPPDDLGRPRSDIDAPRLNQLARLATAPTRAPGVVVAALVHGELLALRPFPEANGLVARAAERLVLVARGVDTKAASVPEAGHLAARSTYEQLVRAYSSGQPDGVAAWVRHCCEAYAAGAEAGLAICTSLG